MGLSIEAEPGIKSRARSSDDDEQGNESVLIQNTNQKAK